MAKVWQSFILFALIFFCGSGFGLTDSSESDPEATATDGLLAFTVATEANDGFRRFMKSANKYHVPVEVLGMGQEWRGGDIAHTVGGGQKVNFLKEAMKKYKDRTDLIVMFVDSYDLVFTSPASEIMKSFLKFDSKIVFSAEGFCWPDSSLSEMYPPVKANEKRYLNSGGYIGYASDIYEIVTHEDIANTDDDQLYFTRIFLNEQLRDKLAMKLDTRGEIFQNLNGALDDVKVMFKGSSSYLYNKRSGNTPSVVHGNGPIKVEFNNIATYLMDQWTPTAGCQACDEDTISLEGVAEEDYPQVFMAIFVEHPTPFLEDGLQRISQLTYPKNKIDVFIHYADLYHKNDTDRFVRLYGENYHSLQVFGPEDDLNEWGARNKALEKCEKANCQYFFALNGESQIEDVKLLETLIEYNRSVIAPMFVRPAKMWSNFWGALSSDGFYRRSDDYGQIVLRNKIGQWNVPYVNDIYLVQAVHLPKLQGAYIDGDLDADMAFCKRLREQGIFMVLDNREYYGHLINAENFDISHLHNDMYSVFENEYTWQLKYIHENYSQVLNQDVLDQDMFQPCTDVYWLPIMSDTFCDHLIEEMEHFGQWSGGRDNYQDTRLNGGYENVPTVDIHTNQIGWEQQWLQFLKIWVAPLNNKVYPGYYTDSRAIMNFVVRYRPDEQDRLRPHHDSSTYTINVALNTPHVDYEGGGVRFIRYNCNVTETRKGWMLMHPGRLTHYHEGLPILSGTRYIMVSFIDP